MIGNKYVRPLPPPPPLYPESCYGTNNALFCTYRFVHRGFHIDVCRNFHSISDLEKLLDVMSQYKLNVLHLHMGDDEGWRLQIPDLPQLTDVSNT